MSKQNVGICAVYLLVQLYIYLPDISVRKSLYPDAGFYHADTKQTVTK